MNIKFISLLNTIPQSQDKYKQPFTECLLQNTQNMQRTLRRALFKCFFRQQAISEEGSEALQIIKFFDRLESELPAINLLQKNVTQSYTRAKEAYDKYQIISSYKINAEGLIQNDESSIIFIESLTQHYQSLDILEILIDCIQLKLDFPFERKVDLKLT